MNDIKAVNELDFDETYTYDDLYRLETVTRDNGFDQSWTLDGLGNWSEFDNDGSTEDHTVNEANEITDLAGTSVIPTYDTAGNMTSGPAPDNPAVRLHYTYDAWNRLVKVYTDDSGNPDDLIAAYEYDAQNRRIVKGVDDNSDGSLDTFTHYFLNRNNQVLETRTGDDLSGQGPTADSLTSTYQNLWSKRYIDALILRDEYSGGVLQTADRIFYLSDANHNVTALVNTSGAVLERYTYTPYGKVTIYDNTWQNERTTSSYANTTLYTGRTLDPETGLMYYRARYYDASLGRFISRDPIGYKGSFQNLYKYVNGNPLSHTDPSGKKICKCACTDILVRPGCFDHRTTTKWTYGATDCAKSCKNTYENGCLGKYVVSRTCKSVPLTNDESLIASLAEGGGKEVESYVIDIIFSVAYADSQALGTWKGFFEAHSKYTPCLAPYGGRCHLWAHEFEEHLYSLQPRGGITRIPRAVSSHIFGPEEVVISLDPSSGYKTHDIVYFKNKSTGKCVVVDDGFWGNLGKVYDPCKVNPPALSAEGKRDWQKICENCNCNNK